MNPERKEIKEMEKRLKIFTGILIGIIFLGVMGGAYAARPTTVLPNGKVPAWITFDPEQDIYSLKTNLEANGAEVISLTPEGTLLVGVPPGRLKAMEGLRGVKGVRAAELPEDPGEQVPASGMRLDGIKVPSAERLAEIEAQTIHVTTLQPNELSLKRAALEGKGRGWGKGGKKKNDTFSPLGEPPSSADNSTSQYFPPIRSQGGQGSCTAWATAYYFLTYTQAKDEGLNASSGNNDYICSPAFIYNLINGGVDGGAWPDEAMLRFCEIGCSSWSLMPYSDSDYTSWPSEAAWVQALNNRCQSHYSIDGHTDEGIASIKQHLANGNIAATTTDVYSNWNPTLINNYSRGVDNGVLFSHEGETLLGAHSLTIVGYDDNRSYYDGSTTKYGAFLVANSWGTGWGTYNSTGTGSRGFMWVAYDYFKEDNYCFGFALYNSDRADYRPELYAVSGLNHTQRGQIIYRGGVGSDPVNPVWLSQRALNRYGGNSISINDSKRVAVDLTDGVSSISDFEDVYLFARLWVDDDASGNGTITSADFYHDFDENGEYIMESSTDPTVTVAPNNTGHATVNFDSTGGNNVPVADAGADKQVRANDVVTFDGSGSTDADQDPLTYTWSFGDGGAATGCTVTHVYTATGNFTVILTVDDGTDADTDTCQVEVLPEQVPFNQWLQGAIHYHTTNSDGSETLETMVTRYRDSGGHDWTCVADHNYISDADYYTSGTFLGINGVEASNGPHVIGFGMGSTGTFSPSTGLQSQINAILNDGGLPIVAHPKWSTDYAGYNMISLIKGMTGCKFIEVYNHYCEDLWGYGNAEAIWDNCLTDNKFLYGTAGDDTHGLGRAGYTYNLVGAQDLTLADIKAAMDIGDSYFAHSTSKWNAGITITDYDVGGINENDVISIDTDVGETIKFIGANGSTLKTVSSDQGSYTLTGNEGYVRIKVTNTDGDETWTQPVQIAGGPPPPPPPPPIEEYEGYEPITTGGEGGQVVWVTNLNSSGGGSLNGALSSLDGSPTIIKFSVGGAIYGTHGIYKPNVTIAGETAPSPGITIYGDYRCVEINTHDVIIRHLRLRNAGGEIIQIFGDYNIIIDHCSFTTCGDGACDINGGTHHVIFSRNLIADAVEAHRAYGIDTAFHHNLYTYNNRRQPKIYYGGPRFDFRNNVVEYWTNTGTNVSISDGVNIINNWYGPPAPGESWTAALMVQASSTNVYIAGNYCEGDPNINNKGDRSSPNPEPDVTTIDAGYALWNDVHRNCGALPRDSIDEYWAGKAQNIPPVAVAGSDQSVYENDVVTFDGSASYDQDNDSLTYTWSFGDGTTGTGVTATHSYSSYGDYTVTLTVDDGEDSDTDVCIVEVLPAGTPRADAGPDQNVLIDATVTFDGSNSYDPDSDPLTYTWEFGDGGTATGVTATHSYSGEGTYTVTLTVDDGTYSDDDVCIITARENNAPVADIQPGNQEVKVNTVVTWDGSGSYDLDSDPLTYTWEFGDGTTSTAEIATHTYTITGTFTCTLTVHDGYESNSDTAQIIVHPNYPPVADAGPDQTVGQYRVVGFDGSGSEDANDDPLTYTWEFGDGLGVTGAIVNHRYIETGSYTVTLTVDDGELSDDDTCIVTVVQPAVTWFYVDKNLGDDNNDGSEENPWKTIQKAADTIGAGEGAIVRPATYYEAVTINNEHGSASHPIIFKAAYEDGKVIVDATGNNIAVDVGKSYVVIDGFQITGGSNYGINCSGGGVDYCVVRNCRIYGNGDGLRTYYGSTDHIWANNLVYDNSGDGIRTQTYSAKNTVIRDCTVYGNGEDGIDLYAAWGVMDSIIVGNTGYGIDANENKVVFYSDVWNNTSGNYNGGVSAGTGCISSDPLFTDAANDDFTLQGSSPCKNAASDGSDMGYAYPPDYTNKAPIADAGTDYSVYVHEPITFDGAATYDPNNDDLSYTWEFGDGTTGTGVPLVHSYATGGDYTVTLTVTDGSLSDSDTCSIEVVTGLTGDYYVALYGDDNNSGAVDQPWLTVQKAADSVAAGDTVIVRAGTYNERVVMHADGTVYAPITFLADAALGDVVIDGSGYNNCFDNDGACVILDGFLMGDSSGDVVQLATDAGDNCVLRNLLIYDSGGDGIQVSGADNARIENCLVYNSSANGIYFTDNADGAVVVNCTVHNSGADSIHDGNSDLIVDSTILTGAAAWGIDTYGTVTVSVDYSDVWDNTSGKYDDTSKVVEGGNCIASDPDFVNAVGGDFRLDTGSPCIGTASDGYDMGYRYPDETNVAPVADAGSDRNVYPDQPLLFDGSGTSDADYDVLSYTWELGDGATAVGCTVSHSYTVTGTYTVTLTVSDGQASDTDAAVYTVMSGAVGDYYVAVYGDDNNAGNASAPWATIQKAADTLTAGQTVVVRAGTYNENVAPVNSGTPGSLITYRADVDVGAVLMDGTGKTNCFNINDAYIAIDGFILKGSGGTALKIATDSGDNNTVKNCIVIDSGGQGIQVGRGDNAVIDNCLIYGSNNNGIYFTDNADNGTITNCTIDDSGADGIHTGTSDIVVEDCIITNNAAWGIDTANAVTVTTDYNDVWNNTSGSYDDTSKISVGGNSISSDPLFVDAANGDYHLDTGSPCIDAASDSGDMGYRY